MTIDQGDQGKFEEIMRAGLVEGELSVIDSASTAFTIEPWSPSREALLQSFDGLLAQLLDISDKDIAKQKQQEFLNGLALKGDFRNLGEIMIKGVRSFALDLSEWVTTAEPVTMRGELSAAGITPWFDFPHFDVDEGEAGIYHRDHGLAVILDSPMLELDDGTVDPLDSPATVSLSYGDPKLYRVLRPL